MKLRRVQVQNFRSIVDSEIVDIEERVTVLVGKNEQGKTNFLKALASFNPKYRYAPNDLPNHLRAQLEEQTPAEIVVVTLWLTPSQSEKVSLREVVPEIDPIEEFKISRYYDGHYTYFALDKQQNEKTVSFFPPDIDHLVDEIERLAEALKGKLIAHADRLPTFASAKSQADGHIDQFVTASFSDPAQIDSLVATFSTALKGLPGQDQAIQDDIAAATKEIHARLSELQQALQGDSQQKFIATIPRFLFHSTVLDRIPNEVNVSAFIADPEGTSKGMANLCQAAGLSTQRIKELASATDHARREVYEDHYRASISGGIDEFWTQETYNVHFRIEHNKLSVSISDGTYTRRIPPSDRSDGFQWYLSFYTALLNEVSATDPMIVLLDNPGLELHSDGQRDIKRFLEKKLPSATQVVYVTHSPAMIDPDNLKQLRQVELRGDMQGTKVLRLALGKDGASDLLEPVRSAIRDVGLTVSVLRLFRRDSRRQD
jgi:predicted ATP-dependent endonuclease of OLD family